MTTIINKTPSEVIIAYRNNKPSNNNTKLFLVKNSLDIPIYGFYIFGNDIYVLDSSLAPVFVTAEDIIELRTNI